MKKDLLLEKINSEGFDIPFSENIETLTRPLVLEKYGITLPNRLIVHPIETFCNGLDGSPADTTWRQYERFSSSGASLIWFEAIAVREDGRSTPRQLWLKEDNIDSFKRLIDMMHEKSDGAPIIAQLTHSGRFSKPHGTAAPIISYHNPIMNRAFDISPDYPVVTDEYIDRLCEDYIRSAKLALEAGFDGIDVKACHRYLMSELLSAYNREGRYGGSYENRTRLFLDVVRGVKALLPAGKILGSRMNLYDGFEYPYGFGVEKEGLGVDMSEPLRLIGDLRAEGLDVINVSMGTPYVNPHVNRPFAHGTYTPPENPLVGVERLIKYTAEAKRAYPDVTFIGTGYTYLGVASQYAAAGAVASGMCDMVGYGRMAIAYPDFARDIINGGLDSRKCCVACGKCTLISRAGGAAGCPIRDTEYFLPMYNKLVLGKG